MYLKNIANKKVYALFVFCYLNYYLLCVVVMNLVKVSLGKNAFQKEERGDVYCI